MFNCTAASLTLILLVAPLAARAGGGQTRVRTSEALRDALSHAKPGLTIVVEPGRYPGGISISNIHGEAGKPIVLCAQPGTWPTIEGGGSGLHLSKVSYLDIRDLYFTNATGNGINIDDGGGDAPSHHVTLTRLRVDNLPPGNHDGIKLSGVDEFQVEDCWVEHWGGSAIDMVGCHRGSIRSCNFQDGGDNAVQCKGSSSEITISKCRFDRTGQRGVNIGGSTGIPFFRPPVAKMAPNARYEAKEIRVEGCTFVGGIAPVAFVGVDGAVVRFNTFYQPEKWLLRILQENGSEGFIRSRNGRFEDNLIIFRSDRWAEGGVNIGPNTAPSTFRFARNFWFCADRPDRSKPSLPSVEVGGVYGLDPMLRDPARGMYGVRPESAAKGVGAHALTKEP
jgi:hypothetical protein